MARNDENKKDVADRYTELSARYDDWFCVSWPEPAIRQGRVFRQMFAELGLPEKCRVLDLTCGMGTQAIGLAMQGHDVTAMDISQGQLNRAREEAEKIGGLEIGFIHGDAEHPQEYVDRPFDVILSFSNSLPLLGSEAAIANAVRGAHGLLKPGGVLLVSMRDHTKWRAERRAERPYVMESGPMVNGDRRGVWLETAEWLDDGRRYISHIIFVMTEPAHEHIHYPFPPLDAITRAEFTALLAEAGFETPGFYADVHGDPGLDVFDCPVYLARKI